MRLTRLAMTSLLIFAALPLAGAAAADDGMPEVQKARYCERVRDFALQAFYDREKGRPIKLFVEDGSDGPRISNAITRKIYDEPQISSPKKAEAYARATCNEMMGAQRTSP
jgi:hypothetical protein